MADSKISALPAGTEPAGVDLLPAVQGGANVKLTVTQVMSAILTLLGDTDATFAGNSATKFAVQSAIKSYIDGKVSGLAWKQSVRAAAVANVTVASGLVNGATIDGVVVATGDRVLLKNQTAGAENGIYVVVASGAASRAADADTAAEIRQASFYVEEGTANGDKQFVLTTNAPITLGSTALVFAVFSSGGAASPTTTLGDLIARGASVDGRLPVGTNGQALLADSSSALGVSWGAAGGVAFDTVTFGPGVTFSNAGRTATAPATGGHQSVRSAIGKSAGKWYAEIVATSAGANSTPGVIKSVAGLSAVQLGDTADSWGYLGDGRYYHSGTPTGTIAPSFTTGDVIMLAVDVDAGLLWFGKNGTWNGGSNPATGAGAHYSGLTGTIHFGSSVFTSSSVTGRFSTSSFGYASPNGFTSLENTGFVSPTTTLGDIIVRGASADGRLAIGATGQVLTVVGGTAAWAAGPIGVVKTSVQVAASDETTALTDSTSVAKLTFRAPFDMSGILVEAGLSIAQASGATLVTLNAKVNGTTMFSTKPTFDNTETTTRTAATPAVQTITTWAKDDIITIFVDALTAASVAAGLKVNFTGTVLGANVIAGVPTVWVAGDGLGDATLNSASYTDLSGASMSLAASVGDIIEVEFNGATYANNSSSSLYYQFTANGVAFGITAEVTNAATNTRLTSVRARLLIQPSHLSGGVVLLKFQWQVPGGNVGTIRNASGFGWFLTAKNFGDGTGIRPSSLTRGILVLTDAATIIVDATNNDQFRVTLGGNRTLGNPTGMVAGQTLLFRISQDGTGSRTLAYSSKWKFAGSAPVLSTTANAKDLLTGQYDPTDDTIFGTLQKAFA